MNIEMRTRTIKVSISEDFLTEVDQHAKASGNTRREFVRKALNWFFADLEREKERAQ